MKKNSRYNIEYLRNIIAVLALGALIALFALDSHSYENSVYAAENVSTASQIDWVAEITYRSIKNPDESKYEGKIASYNIKINDGKEDLIKGSYSIGAIEDKINNGHSDRTYTLTVTGAKLSDGKEATITSNNSQERPVDIKEGSWKLSFKLNNLDFIVNTSSSSSKTGYNEGSIVDEDDVGIKEEKISASKVQKILESQTDETIKKKIADALTTGKSVTIKLVTEELSKSQVDGIDSKARDKIEDKAEDSKSDAKINNYFDLALQLLIDDVKEADIEDTFGNEISLTYTVPSDISSSSSSNGKSYKRYTRVYRYHNGDVEKVSGDWSTDSKLTIKSDKFSHNH